MFNSKAGVFLALRLEKAGFVCRFLAYFILELIVICFTSVLLHEIGHLAAGLIFGWRVQAFAIGFGLNLVDFTFMGIHWQINALPLGGYVLFHEVSIVAAPYLEKMLVFSAGLTVNGLLALAMYQFGLRCALGSAWQKFCRYFAVGNLLLLGFNLMPYSVNDGGKIVDFTLAFFVSQETLENNAILLIGRILAGIAIMIYFNMLSDKVKKRFLS